MEKLESGADRAVLDTGDPSIFRYDQFEALSYDNSAMHMGTNSTAYYFSVASGSIGEFFDREQQLALVGGKFAGADRTHELFGAPGGNLPAYQTVLRLYALHVEAHHLTQTGKANTH